MLNSDLKLDSYIRAIDEDSERMFVSFIAPEDTNVRLKYSVFRRVRSDQE